MHSRPLSSPPSRQFLSISQANVVRSRCYRVVVRAPGSQRIDLTIRFSRSHRSVALLSSMPFSKITLPTLVLSLYMRDQESTSPLYL